MRIFGRNKTTNAQTRKYSPRVLEAILPMAKRGGSSRSVSKRFHAPNIGTPVLTQ